MHCRPCQALDPLPQYAHRRAAAALYRVIFALAVGGGSAQTVFNRWMNSAPHTADFLSPNHTQFGVGYVHNADSDRGGYFVVVFAGPG